MPLESNREQRPEQRIRSADYDAKSETLTLTLGNGEVVTAPVVVQFGLGKVTGFKVERPDGREHRGAVVLWVVTLPGEKAERIWIALPVIEFMDMAEMAAQMARHLLVTGVVDQVCGCDDCSSGAVAPGECSKCNHQTRPGPPGIVETEPGTLPIPPAFLISGDTAAIDPPE